MAVSTAYNNPWGNLGTSIGNALKKKTNTATPLGTPDISANNSMTAALDVNAGSNTFAPTSYLDQANAYRLQIEELLNTPFSYNYQTDPSFIAAQQLAQSGAARAKDTTYADMADRGILNSTITSDRVAEINRDAELKPLEMIPSLQAQALSQRNADLNTLLNLYSSAQSAGMQEQQFNRMFPLQEAAVTGRYLPDGAKELIDSIISAKSQWATADKETQEQLRQIGIDARSRLAAMGIDAENLFGAHLSTDEARTNIAKAGMMTSQSQNQLLNFLMNLGNTYGAIPQGASNVLSGTPLYGGLSGVLQSLEGVPNLAQKQFDLSQEKFYFDQKDSEARNRIAQANYLLNKQAQEFSQGRRIADELSRKNTNAMVTQVLAGEYQDKNGVKHPIKSREDALNFLVNYAEDIAAGNIDPREIFFAIDQKFPKVGTERPESSSNSNSNDSPWWMIGQ